METIKTSQIYQKLDSLYYTLTSVIPSVSSPKASYYMIKGVLEETSYIYQLINSLQERWRELLPFEEDDSKPEKWAYWAEYLKPSKMVILKPFYHRTIFNSISVIEDADELMNKIKVESVELYHKLEKLSKALFILDSIVKAVEPDAIHKLYQDLRTRCEDTYIYTKHNLSEMSLYDLNDYKEQLLLSVFEKLIRENNDQKRLDKWEGMVNEYGVPDVRILGRYIYEHRFELSIYKLREYFEYERVVNFIYQSYNKELNHESSLFDFTDIINPGVDKDKLKKVIQNKFIPKFKIKNRWLCAWRVLKDTHILIDIATIDHFMELMVHWFPSKFNKEDLKYYKDTYLAKVPRKEWNEEKYKEDIITHRRASKKAIVFFGALCSELEEILKTMKLGIR